MEISITNILLTVIPVITFFSALLGASFLTNHLCKKKKLEFPFGTVNVVLLIGMIMVSVTQMFTSPIVTPTTDIHDKRSEVFTLKREQPADVVKPVLTDNSRQSPVEDLSGTPLFDEAMKQ